MTAISSTVRGGDKLQAHLEKLAASLSTARSVKVGFLESATYPARENNAERLLKGLDKQSRIGLTVLGDKYGAKTTRLHDYRKRRKSFVGPPKPVVSLHVAQVAFWNEFGTAMAPARPFMRNTIAKHRDEWGGNLAEFLKGSRFSAQVSLRKLGVLVSEQFRQAIVDWPADNAPLTVSIKGFNHGLIDKGIMMRSVDFEVVGKET